MLVYYYGIQGCSMSTYCYPIYPGALFNFKTFTSPLPVNWHKGMDHRGRNPIVSRTNYLRELTLPVYMHVYSEVGICHGKPIPIQPNNTQPGILPPSFHNPAFHTSYSYIHSNTIGKPWKSPTSLPTEERDCVCVLVCVLVYKC